jgi:glycogen synthase
MRIAILTNEYPPHIYGGAGVHVEYLTRELTNMDDKQHTVEVLCFGDQKEQTGNLTVEGVDPQFMPPFRDPRHKKFMQTMVNNIVMAGMLRDVDIVHCHTWYAHFAGCLVKQLTGAKLVLTTHSLEPHRPWKVEQLGTAYGASSWVERTAFENADGVVAVSESMRRDVHDLYGVSFDKIRVIYNGIDLNQYKPTLNADLVRSFGIDPDIPFVLFVGRITRQKGIIHLVNAIRHINPDTQIVLCAGAPDTEEIGKEMADKVEQARGETSNKIIWIARIVPKEDLITLYSHASIFVCPSVYEPFGIINLEAMACETPVIASAVGGIPEIIIPGETGVLVPFEPVSALDFEPNDPDRFSFDLASSINSLLETPDTLKSMSLKSRERVEKYFSWNSITESTLDFYRSLL